MSVNDIIDEFDARMVEIEKATDETRIREAIEYGILTSQIERYKKELNDLIHEYNDLKYKVSKLDTIISDAIEKANEEADSIVRAARQASNKEARDVRRQTRNLSASMTIASGVAGIIIGVMTNAIFATK